MQYIPGKSLDKVIAEGPASMQLVLSSGHPDRGRSGGGALRWASSIAT